MKKATGQYIKTHNNQLILKSIYDAEKISRADIARLTGLTRATVSSAVDKLIKDGLVRELGLGISGGGKPPMLLTVADDSRNLIGIDLADSDFSGALVNLRGKIKQRFSIAAGDRVGDAALSLVYELIEKLIASAERPIQGIGIGTPGLIDVERGVVVRTANLDWHDLPLADLLKERFKLPVTISNDCRAAALGEFTFGNGADAANLVVIKICRGTGAGIVLNRQLYFGDGYGAGEVGHLTVVENGELCPCGKRGCLETVTCSRYIIKRARDIARDDPRSLLGRFASMPEAITIDTVVQAFTTGDEALHLLVAEVGSHLGVMAAGLVNVLNIHRIVIAGSVARFGQALLDPIRREMNQRALNLLADDTVIEISSLGSDIVILGAAALLLNNGLLPP